MPEISCKPIKALENSNIFLIAALTTILNACQISAETNINADGSGIYNLSLDLSEMLQQMGSNANKESFFFGDTLIECAEYLELKKDSITKLSKAQQEKLNNLKNYSIRLTNDTLAKVFKMDILYKFKELKDVEEFGSFLKEQNIPELDIFLKTLPQNSNSLGILEFNKSFNTTYNNKTFSLNITPEAFNSAEAKKDPNLKKDTPQANILKIKMKYNFPQKIKIINNPNAKLTADSKGFEIYATSYDLNYNARYFDTVITFE